MAVLIFWIHIANERDTIVAVRNFYGESARETNLRLSGRDSANT